MRLEGSPVLDWHARRTNTLMHVHTPPHTHDEHRAVQLALGFPITRSRACSCSSCCCKISNCLCSSSNCRLMYSWRGRQQRIQRNTKRERERKRTSNFKGDKSCQVKCGRKEGKKQQHPDTSSQNRKSMSTKAKAFQCSQRHKPATCNSLPRWLGALLWLFGFNKPSYILKLSLLVPSLWATWN